MKPLSILLIICRLSHTGVCVLNTPTKLGACLLINLFTYLPICQDAYLSVYLSVYQSACLPACHYYVCLGLSSVYLLLIYLSYLSYLCLSVWLSSCFPVSYLCLSTCLSLYLSFLSVCLGLSICLGLSVYLLVCPSTRPFMHLSVCLYVCLCLICKQQSTLGYWHIHTNLCMFESACIYQIQHKSTQPRNFENFLGRRAWNWLMNLATNPAYSSISCRTTVASDCQPVLCSSLL